jgi:hypothetical protein
VGKREFQLGILQEPSETDRERGRARKTHVELFGGGALAIGGFDRGGADDLDGLLACTMATSHVIVCQDQGQ